MLDNFLDAEWRRRLYGVLAALGVIVTALGLGSQADLDGWVGNIQLVLTALAGLLASFKAKNPNWKGIYILGVAVAGLLKYGGLVEDGVLDHWLSVLASLVAAAPLIWAFFRTSTLTPTAEPPGEFAARTTAVTNAENTAVVRSEVGRARLWLMLAAAAIVVCIGAVSAQADSDGVAEAARFLTWYWAG